MVEINLIQQIESIRTELTSSIEAGGALDAIYDKSFEEGKNAVCDNLIAKVQAGEINHDNIQTYVATIQGEISDLIRQRQAIENDCTEAGTSERARINSYIDALSSFSSYLSTLLSEIAKDRYAK